MCTMVARMDWSCQVDKPCSLALGILVTISRVFGQYHKGLTAVAGVQVLADYQIQWT